MKKIIKEQVALKAALDQAYTNFRKTGDSRRKPAYLSERIKQISELWTQFQRNHFAITTEEIKDEIADLAENYITGNTYEEFEGKYFEFLGELQDLLEQKTATNKTVNSSKQEQYGGKVDLKLPRIDLPKFSGDYKSWRSFHDLFVSLIQSDARIPDVQKLHYLKSCLTGEAERIIKQFDMVETNFAAAWQTLIDRYNNKRMLVTSQLKELFNQPMIKCESKRAIKELLDKTKECIHELNALSITTTDWDPIIIYLMVQRLPHETHKLWEHNISKRRELPKVSDMYDFLEARFRTLEAMSDSNTQGPSDRPRKTNSYHIKEGTKCVACKQVHSLKNCKKLDKLQSNTKRNILRKHRICFSCLQRHGNGNCQMNKTCPLCKTFHALWKCDSFKQLSIAEKRKLITKHELCSNCLTKHKNISCPSKRGCFKCGKRHHTSIHEEKTTSKSTINTAGQPSASQIKQESSVECHYNRNATQALLATAIVTVKTKNGVTLPLRALIDLGSQSSFITESAFQTLQLKGHPAHLQISGLGSTNLTTSRKETAFTLQSNTTKFELPMKAYVIKKITSITPPTQLRLANAKFYENLQLADIEFTKPGNIDLLLGVNVYAKILTNGIIQGENGLPTAQNTKLGWILFGEVPSRVEDGRTSSFTALIEQKPTLEMLNSQMQKFWECEELPNRLVTREEKECEEQYNKTTIRLNTGEYQVRLPFKSNKSPILGDSRKQAMSRYLQLEKKLKQNTELHKEYVNCLNDYAELGHMVLANQTNDAKHNYYMPHHAVLKESTTTKVRVVFDASAKTTNGLSLNEQMMNGPTIQPKLYAILLNWRKHKFVMTADIQKMYRMIKMHPEDQRYQTILWRDSTTAPIQAYKLTTVTFGTTAAPYLAIRTLHQLAHDERKNFPQASEIVLRDFYVDDLLTGADDIHQAVRLQQELMALLQSGGFHLRKWTANNDKLLQQVPEADREVNLPLQLHEEKDIKALGIHWHPASDYFSFVIKPAEFDKPPISKRNILSEIAKLYDPLGWLAPSVIVAKMLMQQLWLCKCSWDELVPDDLGNEWQKFKDELAYFNDIKIPRWVQTTSANLNQQLHAFCDASTRAYAAVVYMRTVDQEGNTHVNLLIAKTKVAPIKPISLPRLELCGAILLSRLVKQVKVDMNLPNIRCYCWSDSNIVLSWLNKPSNHWQTFVANRVGEIQEDNANNSWSYVSSKENPADIATRGISPRNLINCDNWWNGPKWLHQNGDNWHEQQTEDIQTTLEKRSSKRTVLTVTHEETIASRVSTFEKAIRVSAYCKRFIANCHNKKRTVGQLTTDELNTAKISIIRQLQLQAFASEVKQLKTGQSISKSSSLVKLSPFIDDNGIVRVGGRLTHSTLPYNSKHPIILPKKDHLTNLIIEYFHKVSLHGGPQLVLTTMRLHGYWVINGMHTIKGQLLKCTKCNRYKATQHTQLMGELPEARVTQARPFQNVGLDYAGPITLKMSKHRGSKVYKGYICIFVCMAVKAIHIEVVTCVFRQWYNCKNHR